MLRAGSAQVRRNDIAVNSTNNEKVGRGIYCSPLFTTCLFEYAKQCTRANETFRIVLQCRIKPEVLKISCREDFWLIN